MADEADGPDEPAGGPAAEGGAVGRPPVRRAVIAALALLLALVGWLGWRDVELRRAEHLRAAMLQAAREGLLALTTIDHEQVDDDVRRILDTSTGELREDFLKRAESFKEAAREARSKSAATVTASAVESVDGENGRVLVTLAVMTSNRGVPEQRPKAWRTRVSVVKDGGSYKVAAVEFVP